MKKVAIVGVEGSGKTVMLAGLGELYSRPDNEGYFLAPKNYATASYVADKIARMRSGQWPVATAEDALQGLDWMLRQKCDSSSRPEDICEVSCLDFAGEVYRSAFGVISRKSDDEETKEVAALKSYIKKATDIIILINLRDIINKGFREERVRESMWITNAILSYAMDTSDGRKEPRATIVLSQADSYADTIKACGGAKGVLAKYLPHVANNYEWLDVFEVSAVDKTLMDDDGNIVPAPDFQPSGLKGIIDWVIANSDDIEKERLIRIVEPLSHNARFYISDNIPSDKIFKALNEYAKRLTSEEVLCLYDSTFFGGGGDGFIISRKGLFWKQLLQDPHFCMWSDISKVRVINSSKISVNGKNMDVPDGFSTQCAKIIEELKALYYKPAPNASPAQKNFIKGCISKIIGMFIAISIIGMIINALLSN